MSENTSGSLTNTERMTLRRLLAWDTLFPPHTRYATLKSLVQRGFVELKVTESGRAASGIAAPAADTPWAAQIRAPRFHGDRSEQGWATMRKFETRQAAADALYDPLHRKGFRLSELMDHVADLVKGHVLAAEDGTEFRVAVSGAEQD